MRFSLLFSLISLFSISAVPAQVVSDKLEAYFSFDDCKGIDDSGNGSNGALIGGITCDCGLRDSAMRFAGLTQPVVSDDALYFVGPFADVFSTSDFTVSFYMRPPQPSIQGGSQLVMAKQDTCDTSHAFWVRYAPKTHRISSGISENDTLIATVTAALDDAPCWQYITLTRSNTVYSLYVNGTLRDSTTSPARIDLTTSAVFKVGEPVCVQDNPYKGLFDELRFHSKALNPEEIKRYNLRADQILNSDTIVYLGNSFQLATTQYCVQSVTWSPSTGVSDIFAPNPVITPVLPTTYQIEFVYADMCTAYDTIRVNVIDPDTLNCNNIFIPNAFTPGGSPNRNDVFGISNPFAVDEFISFEIFDRWGGRVFVAEKSTDAWDGTSQGQNVNPGVFLYRLRYKCDGVEKAKAGSLTLLR